MGPDFLCIGQQKAGTTWLYDQLQFHSGFWMPPVKELHYLSMAFPHRKTLADLKRSEGPPNKIAKWQKLRRGENQKVLCEADFAFFNRVRAAIDEPWSLDCYASLFREKADKLSGDISPSTGLIHRDRIAAIAERFPRVKIILLVRDPIERAWSNLNKGIRQGSINPVDLSNPALLDRHLNSAGLDRQSRGTEIARAWRQHFGDDQFRSYLFDDIVSTPDTVLGDVLGFMAANGASVGISANFNRKADHQKVAMPDAMRSALIARFANEVLASAAMFGGAASLWPSKYGL